MTVEEDELLALRAPFVDSEAVRHEHLGAEGGGARIKVGGIRTLFRKSAPLPKFLPRKQNPISFPVVYREQLRLAKVG